MNASVSTIEYIPGEKYMFKDICLGKEREFEMTVRDSTKVGTDVIVLAVETDETSSTNFYYIIKNGYIEHCVWDCVRGWNYYQRSIEKCEKELLKKDMVILDK